MSAAVEHDVSRSGSEKQLSPAHRAQDIVDEA
jgi:hypothetical protein